MGNRRMQRAKAKRSRLWLVLVACTMVAALAAPGVTRPDAAMAQADPFAVTVTPTADVIDGQQLVINIKTDAANANPINEAWAYVCRANVTYLPGDVDRQSPESRPGGPNCPPTGLSTSAQPIAVSSRTFKFAPTPEGENLFLRVGVGVVEWTDTVSGGASRLACDASTPCVLLVQLKTAAGWLPLAFDLTFRVSDAVGGCGGAAPGALTSAGSDALSDAWIEWTLATCANAGTGAWSTLALGEESQAVRRFAEGQTDVAYTALGYNEQAGFVEGLPAPRSAVAVPIGVSAATLALGNGYQDADGRKLPFSNPAMSLDEVTTLLAGGEFPFRDLGVPIGVRNPELAGSNLMMNTATGLKVGAPAEAGITPWALTRHFDTLRPDQWRVPDLPLFPEAGQPRGVDASFPLASPSYANVLTTLTGRPALAKAFGGLGPSELGGIWVFTDLTTAAAYDIRPAAIETASGEFVAPTNETLASAVASMDISEDGMRVPNPATVDGYPLTYVVYALVPAQPLTDTTGVCRTDSQQLLADWLTYVVRDGQNSMPAGLVPLTSELQAEAEAALQEVGQTPGAPCPVPGIPPLPGAPAPIPQAAVAGTTDGSGSSRPTGSGSPAGAATASTGANDAVEQANAELTVSESDPGFFGGTLPSVLAALAALLGIGGLTTLAAKQTGRRALPPGPEMTRLPPPPDAAIGS